MGGRETGLANRIFYLDALRVMATFAVMLLHVSGSNWSFVPVDSFAWQVFNFYDGLVRFSVPVFVMISGVFFLDNNRPIRLKKLFRRNILRIGTAFLFWSTSYALYQLLHSGGQDRQVAAKTFFDNLIFGNYHMWFLFTIAALYLVTPLLRRISADKRATEYFLLLSFLFCYVVNMLELLPPLRSYVSVIMAKANLDFVLGYTGYFLLGYYLHQYGLQQREKRVVYLLALASAVFTVAGTSWWSLRSGAGRGELYGYLIPNTFFISCAIFLFFREHVSAARLPAGVVSAVEKISGLSFGMYLVHDFFNLYFRDIGFVTTSFSPLLSVPVISCAVFLLSLAVSAALRRIPVIHSYIM